MTSPTAIGRSPAAEASSPESLHHHIVIVGGGTAGLTVAARLTKGWFNKADVAVIEPSDKHYYQPLWTLVGGGIVPREVTQRDQASVMPPRARWIRDAVEEFLPGENLVKTRDGKSISYDWLIVAAGIQINWDAIAGLSDSLGRDGVCSNYSYDSVDSTWQALKAFPKGGTAIFTQPVGGIKCGGAPQKICYLAEDVLRRTQRREGSRIIFASAGPAIFPLPKYRAALEKVVARKGIETLFRHNLVEVIGDRNQAVLENLDTHDRVTIPFDMLHVTPPMSAPGFIASSPLANTAGWVEVDKETLQHTRYANIFALGDCSSLPTSKTGAAVRKQAPVLVRNLRAAMAGKPLPGKYNGYTSCPIVTGRGSLILAEFDYDGNPAETFPFDQAKERWSMWLLKRYLLPRLYWYGMLKGRA